MIKAQCFGDLNKDHLISDSTIFRKKLNDGQSSSKKNIGLSRAMGADHQLSIKKQKHLVFKCQCAGFDYRKTIIWQMIQQILCIENLSFSGSFSGQYEFFWKG